MEQEMKYVYMVYSCGSFSKAAEKLYITQPALSLAIRRVEEQLGARLFDRSSKSLKLTEAGEIYIAKYYRIRDLEKELEQQLNDLSGLRSGSLHIGGTNYFNSYILPPVIVRFHEKYPGIDIRLTEAGSHDLLGMLREHRIDLTFNCGLSAKDPYIRKACFSDTVLLCVPKSFPLPQGTEKAAMTNTDILAKRHLDESFPAVGLKQFKDLPFVLLSDGNNLYERAKIMLDKEHASVKVTMHLTQLATAWHLSCAGLGVTLISDHLVTKGSDSVYFFQLDSPLSRRVFDLVYSENRYVSHAMDAFEETFREVYTLPL